MANEIDRLRELNARLQLVPKGTTVDELERNASAFTHEAAKLLNGEGWVRIRKTEGKNVDGLDIDKLVNRHTFETRDIVIAAGAPHATVGWLHVGEFTDRSRFFDVRGDDPSPAPPRVDPPTAPPDVVEWAELRDAIIDIANSQDQIHSQLNRIAGALERIAERVESAKLLETW